MLRVLGVLFILALPAQAQQVLVRSGEHPGFTRLVLETPAGADWQIVAVPGGWQITTSGNPRFDLSQVWRLIGRERLTGLSQTGASLRMESLCECHIRAWTFNGKPVIDLYDGPPRPDLNDIGRYQAPISLPPLAERSESVQDAERIEAAESEPDTKEDYSAVAAEPLSASEASAADLGGAVDRAARDGHRPAGPEAEDLAMLVEARRRAAGLEAQLRDELSNEASSSGEGFGVRADASERSGDSTATETTEQGEICPNAENLDPGGWGRLENGRANIAASFSALAGELDSWNPKGVLPAVRQYLFLGFGAEALQLLSTIPAGPADWESLAAMAEIMEKDGEIPVGAALDGWESCDSIAALWSVLAGPPLRRGQGVESDAVVQAFYSLPAHLRQLLGPRLISEFANSGRVESANLLRNALRLGEADPTPQAAVAEATLELAMGEHATAAKVIEGGLEGSGPGLHLVLIEQARQLVHSDRPLDSDLLGALEAISFEQRYAPTGAQVEEILTRNDIITGNFIAARERLELRLNAQDMSSVYRKMYFAAAERAENAEFLRLVLPSPRGLNGSSSDKSTWQAIVTRLLKIGFAEEALVILDAADIGAEAQLLAAQAELSLGRMSAVLHRLDGDESTEAMALRATAYEANGHAALAQALYLSAGKLDDARRMAVLSADWALVAGTADPLAEAAGALLAGEAPPPIDEPYAEAERLLQGSARERAAFATYLAHRGEI